MRAALLFAFLILSNASYTHAANEISAGFAPGQVWLSRSAPIEGETVEIYTVIYDASGSALEGSVTFLVDGESVGASPFTLRGGKTEIRSIRWQAIAGEHAFAARVDSAIYADSKQSAPLLHQTTGTTTVSVAKREQSTEEEEGIRSERTSVRGTSTSIVTTITQTPIVGTALGTVIDATESIRTAGESLVQSYIRTTTSSTSASSTGEVLGTSTERVEDESPSLGSRAASVALPAFRTPSLFYPIAILLILFGLWIIARQVRNPRKRRRYRR